MDFNLSQFQEKYDAKKTKFEGFLLKEWLRLKTQIQEMPQTGFGQQDILESIEYSLLHGGKRFRPVLALAVAEACGASEEKVLPWAMAVEMIHTYSLIHDDLPCMDNDDLRRGILTNHKKFGESTALLAGDALLTEAFGVVAEHFPQQAGILVKTLAQSAGLKGMLLGQCLDLAYEKQELKDYRVLKTVHQLKTGRLIQASATGAAEICGGSTAVFGEYGMQLGLCFQIADDLLDKDNHEAQNFVSIVGECSTRDLLEEHFLKAEKSLTGVSSPQFLKDLASYNLIRIS